MRKISFLFFYLLCLPIIGSTMNHADQKESKEEFIPWFTGPLMAASANNLYKAQWNLQPYFFYGHSDKVFQRHHGLIKTADTQTASYLQLIQRGLTDWLDMTIYPKCSYSIQKSKNAWAFMDLPVQFGFQLLRSQPHTLLPSIRVAIIEKFPTGKYEHLSSMKNGIDAGGNGSYETRFGLYLSKTIYLTAHHPVAFRINLSQSIGSTIHVHGFHAFGGGFGTRGKIRVPKDTNAIFAFELSMTQHWVVACDFSYSYSSPSHFRGTKGVTSSGAPATNDSGLSDTLTIAPAIEYNINNYSGIIGGVLFTVYGRNSPDRIDGVLSYTVTF